MTYDRRQRLSQEKKSLSIFVLQTSQLRCPRAVAIPSEQTQQTFNDFTQL